MTHHLRFNFTPFYNFIWLTIHPLYSPFVIQLRFYNSILLIISYLIWIIISNSIWLSCLVLFDTHCKYLTHHIWFDSSIPIQFCSEFIIWFYQVLLFDLNTNIYVQLTISYFLESSSHILIISLTSFTEVINNQPSTTINDVINHLWMKSQFLLTINWSNYHSFFLRSDIIYDIFIINLWYKDHSRNVSNWNLSFNYHMHTFNFWSINQSK